jgi:hypothetical protein
MTRKQHYLVVILVLAMLYSIVLLQTNQSLQAEPSGSLLINEIMYHPAENENTNEWIEVYNPTLEHVDVAGWLIADEKETDIIQADTDHGDGTTSIPPGGYAIITDKGTTIYETYAVDQNAVRLSVDDSTLCGYGLNNQKEKIILMNQDGIVIDAIEWGDDYDDIPGSPHATIAEGHSLTRYPQTDTDDSSLDFFECSTPTPGGENIQEVQDDQSDGFTSEENIGCMSPSVLITELYYDAHSNINAEYVRLLNPTNKSINVSGWYLTDEPWSEPDDQKRFCIPLGNHTAS